MGILEQQTVAQALEKLIDSRLQQYKAEIVQLCKPDVSGFALKTDLSGLALKTEVEAKIANKLNEVIVNYDKNYITPIKKDLNENKQKVQVVDGDLKNFKTMLPGFVLKTDLSGFALKTEIEAKIVNKLDEFIRSYHSSHITPIKNGITESAERLKDIDFDIKNLKMMLVEKEKEIKELLGRIADIEDDLKNHINAPQPLKNQSSTAFSVSATIPAASNNYNKETLETFNRWAKYPSRNLSTADFSYVSGEFHLRIKQNLTITDEPTAWIVNKTGPRMLLPNPNFLDPMRDISELYTMDQNRLKPKGQNSFRITKPCLMAETGFIEFPGELELL
jgi:hypothetical protein